MDTSLKTYEYKENKSYLIPFFSEYFSNIEMEISPLIKSLTSTLKRNLNSESDRIRENIIGLISNSPLIQLYTETKIGEAALWVLFRDTFVFMMMDKTTFFDFASGANPFDGIIDAYALLNNENDCKIQIENKESVPEQKEKQFYEDELVFNEGIVQNQRPALLYIIESVAFNVMQFRRRKPNHDQFDSSDLTFKILSDMIIQMKYNKHSLEKLSKLLSFIPIQSKLFNHLTKTIFKIKIDEYFFTNGELNKVVLNFLLANIQEIFLWVSTNKFFQLMMALSDMVDSDSSAEIMIPNPSNPNEILDRKFFKEKIRDILKLKEFVTNIQKQLLRLDFEKLKKVLFLNESNMCTTFFIENNPVLQDLEYRFNIDIFREENITIKNMNYINKKKQCHRMTLFAKLEHKTDPAQSAKTQHSFTLSQIESHEMDLTKFKKSSISVLDRLVEHNIKILEESSLYRKLRLVVQNNQRIYLSKPFQQLLEFLFRSLIRWLKKNPTAPRDQIEQHFHLLVGDCGDLNILVNVLLEETKNFSGNVAELLGWISQSPNDVFLRILIDKFSQVIFEFARKEESSLSLFSKARLLKMLNLNCPSQAELSITLIRKYEQHLLATQIVNDPVLSKNSESLQEFQPNVASDLNILTLMFYLRSELRILIDRTSEDDPHDMLQVGRFLISESSISTQSRVRNSVLIYLLGSLQDKFGFLENQLSKFRPLLPASLLNSQFHCLRIYNDQILGSSALYISKILRKISRNEPLSISPNFSPKDYYSLVVSMINQQMTLPVHSTKNRNIFSKVKQNCNPIQQFFLEAILNDFESSENVSLKQASEEYLTPIILLILNVTLSTIVTLKHSWFLSRLMQDLTVSFTNRIPFNFKNVLLFDQNLNSSINKNKSSAKLYECVNCGTPFSIGDCGNPVLLKKAAQCINCKKEIGAESFHKPNDNTRAITFEEFKKKSLTSPLYSVHEFLIDETVTMEELPRFGFRIGHLLTHCLYAGLTLTGLIDCPQLLLANVQTSHPHLNLNENNLFHYFYRHVQCDLNWLKKELRINELPVEFLGYILQDIVNTPGLMLIDEELSRVQNDFSSHVEGYRMRFAQILVEVRSKRGKIVSQEVVSEDAIKRNIDFEEVEDDVDRFLFLNLRQTSDLNLLLFHSQLKNQEEKFPNLDFYLDHFVIIIFIVSLY